MEWDYPISVTFENGEELAITNKCDYRTMLDIMCLFENPNFSNETKIRVALEMFYDEPEKIPDIERAVQEMYRILACMRPDEYERAKARKEPKEKRLMSWEQDFRLIAPEVSKVLGYNIQTPNKYTHFWSFISAYMAMGDCTFKHIVELRRKRNKGEKLDKYEEKFIRENASLFYLYTDMTDEAKEWLEGGD